MAKTAHIQARVEPELRRVVITKALWEGISKSRALRAIVTEYGQKHGILGGNGQGQQQKQEVRSCEEVA